MKRSKTIILVAISLVSLCTASVGLADPLSSYTIFAQQRVHIGTNSTITGLVGANFLTDSDSPPANVEVALNGGAEIIGNVQSGDDVNLQNNATITGTVTLPESPAGLNPLNPGGAGTLMLGSGSTTGAVINAMPSLPSLPAASVFSTGVGTTTTGGGQTTTLTPGMYGSYTFGNTNTLNLSSGTYAFSSLSAGSTLTLNINLSGGPVHIFVSGAITFGTVNMVLTGGTAANLTWEADAAGAGAFTATGGSSVSGDVFTPNGEILIGSSGGGATFNGHLWAGTDVEIQHGVIGGAVPEPSTLALIVAGGVAGAFWRRRR